MSEFIKGDDGTWSKVTTTDGGHAKAELAWQYLEHISKLSYEKLDAVTIKKLKEIEDYCWPIITEYFKP